VIIMVDPMEIDNAIAAHGAWKSRLKTAIDTGTLETSPATIGADNKCAFGGWLYGSTLTPQEKASPEYNEIKRLHAQFHQLAGRVAQLALAGKKAEAEAIMGPSAEYAAISGKLTLALMQWKKSKLQTVAR
jgi:hypothetical protein